MQVPLNSESLCNSDAYILDLGTKLYQFNGIKSSGWAKRKTYQEVNGLKSGRYGNVNFTFIIDGLDDDCAPQEFWDAFGGKPEFLPDHVAVSESEQKNKEVEKPSMWKYAYCCYFQHFSSQCFKEYPHHQEMKRKLRKL